LSLGSSNVQERLIAWKVRPGIKLLFELADRPQLMKHSQTDGSLQGSWEYLPLQSLTKQLYTLPQGLASNEEILRLASKPYAAQNYRVLPALVGRDMPEAVDFVFKGPSEDIADRLNYFSSRKLGPKLMAELQKRKNEFPEDSQDLLTAILLNDETAFQAFLARFELGVAKDKDFEIAAYRFGIHADEKLIKLAGAFLVDAAKNQRLESLDRHLVTHTLKQISKSSAPSEIQGMIDLLECDLSALATPYKSEREIKQFIAGLLVEMTGESFGENFEQWKTWCNNRLAD